MYKFAFDSSVPSSIALRASVPQGHLEIRHDVTVILAEQVEYDQPKQQGGTRAGSAELADMRPALDWTPGGWSLAGFVAADVGGKVDGSSSVAARRTVSEIFSRRFLARRQEVLHVLLPPRPLHGGSCLEPSPRCWAPPFRASIFEVVL